MNYIYRIIGFFFKGHVNYWYEQLVNYYVPESKRK